MRHLSVQLGEQKQREQQEVQILSDMLSMTLGSPTSGMGGKQSRVMSPGRRESVYSPQRPPLSNMKLQPGFIASQTRPRLSAYSSGSYHNILSEINNIVNHQPSSQTAFYHNHLQNQQENMMPSRLINTVSTNEKQHPHCLDLTSPSINQVQAPHSNFAPFLSQITNGQQPPQFSRQIMGANTFDGVNEGAWKNMTQPYATPQRL